MHDNDQGDGDSEFAERCDLHGVKSGDCSRGETRRLQQCHESYRSYPGSREAGVAAGRGRQEYVDRQLDHEDVRRDEARKMSVKGSCKAGERGAHPERLEFEAKHRLSGHGSDLFIVAYGTQRPAERTPQKPVENEGGDADECPGEKEIEVGKGTAEIALERSDDPGDAVATLREPLLVCFRQAQNLGEAERHDREIVAAQIADDKAKGDADR